jgi:hypothetical protein
MKLSIEKGVLVRLNRGQEATKRKILGLAKELCERKNSLFSNFLLHCVLSAKAWDNTKGVLPLAAVKVMTTILPKLEIAMKAERIRSGWLSSFERDPKVI